MNNQTLIMLVLLFPIACGCSKNARDKDIAASAEPSGAVFASSDYSSLDGNGSGWGFVRRKGKPPELSAAQISVLEDNGGIYLDKSGEKSLYLTFDEGYENGYTAAILDTLAKTETPAAFFVTGPYLEGQGDLIRRMIDDGHIVGNHTVHHLNLPNQPVKTVQKEITDLNSRCEELYGYTMKYMRPPEGEFSERTLAVTNDLGLKTVMWSFAYKDWDVNNQSGAAHAKESILPYLHDGAIILLHAVSSDNASALEDIINEARSEGFVFKSLDNFGKSIAAGTQ